MRDLMKCEQNKQPFTPTVCLLERLLLSMQALSQLHIHADEIIPFRARKILQRYWLLPSASAINTKDFYDSSIWMS